MYADGTVIGLALVTGVAGLWLSSFTGSLTLNDIAGTLYVLEPVQARVWLRTPHTAVISKPS